MKVCVLGATGPSGQQVVKEALARGYQVNALVRNPDKMEQSHENLKVVKVNIFESDTMVEPMRGCDAVLSCLGTGPSYFSLWTITFYTDSIKPIVQAMRKAGVKRLVVMASWYTKYNSTDPFFINWFLKPMFLGQSLHNMGEMEDYLTAECDDIDYTSVRPPQLTNTESTGKPVDGVEGQLIPGKRHFACRQDVAKFMLDSAESGDWVKKFVAIASG